MCGIYGVVDLKQLESGQELLARMGRVLVHRGPDDEGYYVGNGVAFGMRRLSIIDLEGGHQPISNEDQTIWTVCNGEIYNFKELRENLEKKGHIFRCHSDTEVIVHLYEQEGVAFLKHLRGMFALTLWDAKHSRLILARDRLGKKPLYIYREPHRILFASEIKSILQAQDVPRRLNLKVLHEYLALGYVPAPWTLLEGIQKLLPGHYLMVEGDKIEDREYWDTRFSGIQARSEGEWIELVREKLIESIRIRLISDVPLGAFLSGGIDSSTIVAIMARLVDQPVKTYSIGFEGKDRYYNELPYARIVSKAFGTDHHEIIVQPRVSELLPRLIWHMDEPVADSAFITTYLVSELASKSVKVILSGVGGDELFGGYRRYLGDSLWRYYGLLPRSVRMKWFPALLSRLPQDRHGSLGNYVRYATTFVKSVDLDPIHRYMRYVGVFSAETRAALLQDHSPSEYMNGHEDISETIQRYFEKCQDTDNLNQMIYVDIKTSLPDDLLVLTDKMSMAASIECRAPFVDHELLELTSQIPSHLKVHGLSMKYLLKEAVKPWLPREILHRKKRGFGAPVGAWLRHDLELLVQETLSETPVRKRGLFNWKTVKETLSMHQARVSDHTDHLLALINFELWCRIFLDGMDQEYTPYQPAGTGRGS